MVLELIDNGPISAGLREGKRAPSLLHPAVVYIIDFSPDSLEIRLGFPSIKMAGASLSNEEKLGFYCCSSFYFPHYPNRLDFRQNSMRTCLLCCRYCVPLAMS